MLGSLRGIGSDMTRFFNVSLSIFAAFNGTPSFLLLSLFATPCCLDTNDAIRFNVELDSLRGSVLVLVANLCVSSNTQDIEFGLSAFDANGTGGAGRTGKFLSLIHISEPTRPY